MLSTFSRSVAPAHWPSDLQAAWAAATRTQSLLHRRGPAVTWSDATRRHVSWALGNFLYWARESGQAPVDCLCVDLVTPDHVRAYAMARRSEICDVSVRSNLVGLVRGMAVLYPERDWSWIRRIIAAIPDGQAASRQRKQPRLRHSLELFELGISLTQQAESDLTRRPIDRAVKFRDGAIIALLALRPIRRKNLAGLLIGVHVTKTAMGWRILLPATEVKNRQEYDQDIPVDIGKLLDRYLAVYRPILLAADCQRAGTPDPYLWISSKGMPMHPNIIWKQVCRHTAGAFGKPVPPHMFRDCAMSTWALDLPTKVRGGIHVLGNRSFAVAQSAYNMAGSNTAAVKLQEALTTLRRTSKPTPLRRRYAKILSNQQS